VQSRVNLVVWRAVCPIPLLSDAEVALTEEARSWSKLIPDLNKQSGSSTGKIQIKQKCIYRERSRSYISVSSGLGGDRKRRIERVIRGPIIDGSLLWHWMTLIELFTKGQSDRLHPETPRQRKRKRSMSRRYQAGNVVKYGNWWIVRFRIDVPNQDQRILTYERICPIKGPGHLSVHDRRDRAASILKES